MGGRWDGVHTAASCRRCAHAVFHYHARKVQHIDGGVDDVSGEQLVAMRQAFVQLPVKKRGEVIASFVADERVYRFYNIPTEAYGAVASLSHLRKGQFNVVHYTRTHCYLVELPASGSNAFRVYKVASPALRDTFGGAVPAYVETVLYSWMGQIICDEVFDKYQLPNNSIESHIYLQRIFCGSIVQSSVVTNLVPPKSRSTAADEARKEGNSHFKAKRYPEAVAFYKAAARHSRTVEPLTNAALAYYRMGDAVAALQCCNTALAIDNRAVKAAYRKAQCMKQL
eukprot:Sspe_Gene.32307::Locus_15842_Transcript_1_1_Confidence_1.000_Length_878::g.32307::m.32307